MTATVVGAIAAAVVGGIVVALAGRWLATPGNTRRANQIRTEAEILSHLPDGAAKDALSEKVQRDVLSHLDLEANRGYRRLRGTITGLSIFDVALVSAMLVGTIVNPPDTAAEAIAQPFFVSGAGVLVVTQLVEFFIGRRLGLIRTRAEEKADEQQAEAEATLEELRVATDRLDRATRKAAERMGVALPEERSTERDGVGGI